MSYLDHVATLVQRVSFLQGQLRVGLWVGVLIPLYSVGFGIFGCVLRGFKQDINQGALVHR